MRTAGWGQRRSWVVCLLVMGCLVKGCVYPTSRFGEGLEPGDVRVRAFGVRPGDQGERPLPGVRVRLLGTNILRNTDGEGRITLRNVPAGEHTMLLEDPGPDGTTLSVVSVPFRLREVGRTRARLDLGNVTLLRAGNIRGTVSGVPPGAQAWVGARFTQSAVAPAPVSAEGGFLLGGFAPGRWEVCAVSSSGASGCTVANVQPGEDTDVDIALVPASVPAALVGVVDAQDVGAPAEDVAQVLVFSDGTTRPAGGNAVAFAGLLPGIYGFGATVPGGEGVWVKAFLVLPEVTDLGTLRVLRASSNPAECSDADADTVCDVFDPTDGARDGGSADAGRLDASAPDGSRADAGGGADAARPDAAMPLDGSLAPDAAGPVDAAQPLDAAAGLDAAPPLDAAAPADASPPLDAAVPDAAGAPMDAGPPPDAAATDAAAPQDAGPPNGLGTCTPGCHCASENFITMAANPAGPWTCGTRAPADTGPATIGGGNIGPAPFIRFAANLQFQEPSCGVNASQMSASVYTTDAVPAGTLVMHPAVAHNAVLRFTSPRARSYAATFGFLGCSSTTPTSTRAVVYVNGSPVSTSTIDVAGGASNVGQYDTMLTLSEAETVDVEVEALGSLSFDSTCVFAQLCPI